MREAGAGVVPHVHLVMPAAAIDREKRLWRTKSGKKGNDKHQTGYLFNHKALAKVFRAKLLAAIQEEALTLPDCYEPTGKWGVRKPQGVGFCPPKMGRRR